MKKQTMLLMLTTPLLLCACSNGGSGEASSSSSSSSSQPSQSSETSSISSSSTTPKKSSEEIAPIFTEVIQKEFDREFPVTHASGNLYAAYTTSDVPIYSLEWKNYDVVSSGNFVKPLSLFVPEISIPENPTEEDLTALLPSLVTMVDSIIDRLYASISFSSLSIHLSSDGTPDGADLSASFRQNTLTACYEDGVAYFDLSQAKNVLATLKSLFSLSNTDALRQFKLTLEKDEETKGETIDLSDLGLGDLGEVSSSSLSKAFATLFQFSETENGYQGKVSLTKANISSRLSALFRVIEEEENKLIDKANEENPDLQLEHISLPGKEEILTIVMTLIKSLDLELVLTFDDDAFGSVSYSAEVTTLDISKIFDSPEDDEENSESSSSTRPFNLNSFLTLEADGSFDFPKWEEVPTIQGKESFAELDTSSIK